VEHFLDRPDAGDGFLRESETHGDRANEFAVDVNRAAAHSLEDAGLGQRPAGKLRQDDGLLRPDVFENAENLDLEFINAIARKNSLPDALHAGPDVLQREDRGLRAQNSRQQETAKETHNLILRGCGTWIVGVGGRLIAYTEISVLYWSLPMIPGTRTALQEKSLPWGAVVWFGALLIACYAPVLTRLAQQWLADEDMGHGFFVPLVAGYIAWQRR